MVDHVATLLKWDVLPSVLVESLRRKATVVGADDEVTAITCSSEEFSALLERSFNVATGVGLVQMVAYGATDAIISSLSHEDCRRFIEGWDRKHKAVSYMKVVYKRY